MPDLKPLIVIVRGEHDMGKTTVANLFRMFLEENGFRHVKVHDTEPLPEEQKSRFWDRLQRNRERPIDIHVELVER